MSSMVRDSLCSERCVAIAASHFVLFGLLACGMPTPHQNFKDILQLSVGMRADQPNIMMNPSDFISNSMLSNDSEVRIYRYRNDCLLKFVIQNDTVIAATFEGSERSCTMTP